MEKKQKGIFVFLGVLLGVFLNVPVYAENATAPDNKIQTKQNAATPNDKPTTTSTTKVAAIENTVSEDEEAPPIQDPYQGFNRPMFALNETLDKYILKPAATFYNLIMPKPLNQGIHNFFLNIQNVPTIVNDVLQANFFQAANDSWRLLINTTVGIGGLFDIAGRINLKPYENDFGMTLEMWGYKNSNYIVLPFWGPRTIRDTLGLPVDYFAFSVYPYIQPPRTRYEIYALSVIDWRANLLQYQDFMDQVAVDRYSFVRNAYMQRRAHQIEENHHRSYKDWEEDVTNQQPVSTVTAATAVEVETEPTAGKNVTASQPEDYEMNLDTAQ